MEAIKTNTLKIYLSEMQDSVNDCNGQFYETASKICNACLNKDNKLLFPINFLLSYTEDIKTIVDMYNNDDNTIVFLSSSAKENDYTEIYDMERIDLYRFCKYLIDKYEKQ